MFKLSLKLLSYVLICVSSSHTGYLMFRCIMGITELKHESNDSSPTFILRLLTTQHDYKQEQR